MMEKELYGARGMNGAVDTQPVFPSPRPGRSTSSNRGVGRRASTKAEFQR
jgi:hypothetical protein